MNVCMRQSVLTKYKLYSYAIWQVRQRGARTCVSASCVGHSTRPWEMLTERRISSKCPTAIFQITIHSIAHVSRLAYVIKMNDGKNWIGKKLILSTSNIIIPIMDDGYKRRQLRDIFRSVARVDNASSIITRHRLFIVRTCSINTIRQ